MEQAGAISGHRAHLDAKALGLTFEALVFVTMAGADRRTVDAFEQAVAAVPHVQQAERLFGDPDYLLRRPNACCGVRRQVRSRSCDGGCARSRPSIRGGGGGWRTSCYAAAGTWSTTSGSAGCGARRACVGR